jgi:zinc/manganese transport system substrate-binding protein
MAQAPGYPPTPVLLGLLLPLLLAGCNAARPPTPTPGRAGAPLRVVTTVLPVGLFTRAVAGTCATVEPLLPAGADLHDLPVSPQLVGRLRGADVLVLNGLGLEAALEPLVAAADRPDLRRVESAAGLAPLPGGADGHDHGHTHDPSHGHGDAGPGSSGAGGAAVNPHVWLDPRRAAGQVRRIRDALVAADPPRAACFRRNADRFLSELQSLDRQLARQLAPHAGQPIVSFHDLAPYFADRYRLRAESVVALPGDNPSVADLRRVADQLRRHRTRAVLIDPVLERSSFTALAADLELEVLPFDPIERASESDARRPAHYLEAMRRNGAAVVKSLAPPPGR